MKKSKLTLPVIALSAMLAFGCGSAEGGAGGSSSYDVPSNPTTPVAPVNPTQPTNPTNPTQPTQPTEPTNPTNPTNPTTPSKHKLTTTCGNDCTGPLHISLCDLEDQVNIKCNELPHSSKEKNDHYLAAFEAFDAAVVDEWERTDGDYHNNTGMSYIYPSRYGNEEIMQSLSANVNGTKRGPCLDAGDLAAGVDAAMKKLDELHAQMGL